ncbi:MAG: hypothetical protein EA399_12020 [Desulfovibrionales bacterium]|nr:MAG: hypothetical protein EA399_12020 [Desulfovibrionales bacterium]
MNKPDHEPAQQYKEEQQRHFGKTAGSAEDGTTGSTGDTGSIPQHQLFFPPDPRVAVVQAMILETVGSSAS